MINVLIVYASQFGSTAKMAEAMAQSALQLNGIASVLKQVDTVTENDFIDAVSGQRLLKKQL